MAVAPVRIPRRQSASRSQSPAPKERPGAGRARRTPSLVGLAQIATLVAIAFGWWIRDERLWVPDRGVGYALGITGLAAMVVMLVYPVRKRVRRMRGVGRIGTWFQLHMLLGLFGPLAILYHANFRLGSTNANVALFCALVVAGSGVVGRVLYVRIHAGLDGHRRTLVELRDELANIERAIAVAPGSQHVVARLSRFESALLDRREAAWRRRWRRLLAGFSARRALRDVRRTVRAASGRTPEAGQREREMLVFARRYVRAVRHVAGFESWERLFALWHVAHLPLSFLLYATATVHVVAVHLY